MSINWVMLTQDGKSPVPLPQEKMFFTQTDVKLVLDCNDEPSYPGNANLCLDIPRGTLMLSNQRIIYLAEKVTPEFQSLNLPITHFKQWKLEQPWFGANYVCGIVLAIAGGGLVKNGQLRLTFSEGGSIEFTTILRNLLERMGETNEIPREYEALPAYAQPQTLPPPPDYSA
ncbi:hypothetical protein BY458DRAFT_528831 [Sporodiniella umbellata]|nr:hypothetical protein BY458DRAFT_528831 [Sporodiniella umbellata]